MAAEILPTGTYIRFKGSTYGTGQPIGEITGHNPDTGYYTCVFMIEGQPWRPLLLRSEFTLYKGGK